jgi:hypothetical protein
MPCVFVKTAETAGRSEHVEGSNLMGKEMAVASRVLCVLICYFYGDSGYLLFSRTR